MVKSVLLIILLSSALISFGQTNSEAEKIETISQAKKFIKKHPNAGVNLLTINSGVDTLQVFMPLYNKAAGYTLQIDNDIYKILKIDSILSYRVNYIYFDVNQLSAKQIDSLRREVISQYKGGVSFFDLVQLYNMDANISGDTQWFTEGMMVKEFEDAVKRHKKGDIFIVDTPDNNWYHVVLKTFDDTYIKSATILKMKNNNLQTNPM